MSTEIVTGTDDNDDDEAYATFEEAIAAAAQASTADGGDGTVIVHMPSCRYEASTGIGCTCTPEVHRIARGEA